MATLKAHMCCSTEGISLPALITEVSCYAAAVAYGSRREYPCTMWGSDLACWLQDSILIGMIAALRGFPVVKTAGLIAAWMVLQACLFTPLMPMWFLAKFQVCSRSSMVSLSAYWAAQQL